MSNKVEREIEEQGDVEDYPVDWKKQTLRLLKQRSDGHFSMMSSSLLCDVNICIVFSQVTSYARRWKSVEQLGCWREQNSYGISYAGKRSSPGPF